MLTEIDLKAGLKLKPSKRVFLSFDGTKFVCTGITLTGGTRYQSYLGWPNKILGKIIEVSAHASKGASLASRSFYLGVFCLSMCSCVAT